MAAAIVGPQRMAGAAPGTYSAVDPVRALDSRPSLAFNPGEVRVIELAGVPSGATGAALNVTAIGGPAASFLTVWPADTPQPWASNVNVAPNSTVANMVLTGVTAGRVNVRNEAGSTHVLIDVVGHFSGEFAGVTPTRVLDTRIGLGAPAQPIGAVQAITVDVRSLPGIPPSAAAVAVNLTATNSTETTYVAAWPADGAVPPSSNLNVTVGQTVANLAVVGISPSGHIALINGAGRVDLVADVLGWFEGSTYHSVAPTRLMDTRLNTCGFTLGPREVRNLTIAGFGGVPATGVGAALLNVTAVGPTEGGYLAVYPSGGGLPNASTLNFVPGQTVPNSVLVGIGAGGQVAIYNPAGVVHVVVDVFGYFDGSGVGAGAPVPCPVPPAPMATFGDGTWRVNVDIPPGRYVLAGSQSCYWERLRGFSGNSADRITNDFVPVGRVIVDILPADAGFSSSRCGLWRTFNPSPNPSPATGFDTGTYAVGRDVYAGLYRAPGSTSCYWERLRGFDGSSGDRITNDFGAVNPLVRIELADVGFSTSNCGVWTRVSD